MDVMYLDNAATTQTHPTVVERMIKSFKNEYANPSSLYDMGLTNEKIIKRAKSTLAGQIHCHPEEIIFTSGGTEGDNFLIKGIIEKQREDRLKASRIITTKIEHPAVKEIFKLYESYGIDVVWLPVKSDGFVDIDTLQKAVTPNTLLVSIIGVNNEIGTIQPLQEIGEIVKQRSPDCFFHSDYVQGFMKEPIDVKKCQLDGLTVCGHKINGPKGIGAVYLKEGKNIKPLMLGGGQENGLRSGTENIQGIVGLEAAIKIWENPDVMKKIKSLRDYVASELIKIGDVKINGPMDACPSVMSVSIKGIRGEVLLHSLEARGVYISTGSACSSHKKEKNTVLKAINLDRDYIEGTIRISFSALTSCAEVKNAVLIIKEEVEKLRAFLNR